MMKYEGMNKDEKLKFVEKFLSVCSGKTEIELRELYKVDGDFRKYYRITYQYFSEYYVEPLIRILQPLIETINKIQKDLEESYMKIANYNLSMSNGASIPQTMSLGS